MLYSCDLENYRQLWWWKEKSTRRRDERVAWPKRQMMLATRVIHINRVFLYLTFERMKLHNQNGRVSIVDIEEILFFNVVSLVLRTGFEDACYEHILLVKSRKDNQWIQLKKDADWGACSYTVHDCSTFFSADIPQGKNGELLIVVYFTRLKCTYTPCLSTWLHLRFSYCIVWKSYQL